MFLWATTATTKNSANRLITVARECADFPCQEYKAWIKDYEHHKRAMEYLQSLRQGS